MPTVNWPSGQMTSSALTLAQMQPLWQTLTLQALGQQAYLDTATTTANSNQVAVTNGGQYQQGQEFWMPGILPPGALIRDINGNILTLSVAATAAASGQCSICQASAGDFVRINFPTNGQPDWPVSKDVVFLYAAEESDPWEAIRDQTQAPNDGTSVNQVKTYNRSWRISWTAYGPNSFDNLRILRSALFEDFATDFLALWHLAPVTDYPAPQRAPRDWQQQYWEEVHFSAQFFELVTETLAVPTVQSVEVKVIDSAAGQVADFTITD